MCPTDDFIFSAPYVVVAKDRGRTLRFYRAANIRLDPDAFHRFLETKGYDETPVWSSSLAPGGSKCALLLFSSSI